MTLTHVQETTVDDYEDIRCIYPSGCLDAFAAHLVHRAGHLGARRYEVSAVDNLTTVPDIKEGQQVVLIGFSYPYSELVKLCRQAVSVTVIVSSAQRQRMVSLAEPSIHYLDNLGVISEVGKSTVGITFSHLFPNLRLPWHYDAIQKFSLGSVDDLEVRYIVAAFKEVGYDAAAWAKLYMSEDGSCPKQRAISRGQNLLNRI